MVPEWTLNHENLLEFADVLIELDYIDTPRDVVYFFAKPYKWDNEYQLWDGCGRPYHGSDNWDWFVKRVEQEERAAADRRGY